MRIKMNQWEKWTWIGIVFWQPISSRETSGWPIKFIEKSEKSRWENELFPSAQNWIWNGQIPVDSEYLINKSQS